jgi:ribonucleoside-triphosphate reductase
VCRTHGYLAGEYHECPDCGKETEIYSRITGYYRPVKNWNEGKLQEFKDRKVYDVLHSAPAEAAAAPETELLLFTAPTCPHCVMARKALDEAQLPYRAMGTDDQEIIKKYDIRQAPTLVVLTDGETARFDGLANVRAYIRSAQQRGA